MEDINDEQETSPLLGPGASKSSAQEASKQSRAIIYNIYAILFAISLAVFVGDGTQFRLLEASLCERRYGSKSQSIGIFERLVQNRCKSPEIQDELASLRGWLTTLNSMPVIFLSIPYGALAEKYGEKPIVVLNLISFAFRDMWMYLVYLFPQHIPPAAILLEFIGVFAGGGSLVFAAMLFTMASKVVAPEDRVAVFFRATAINSLCGFIGPLISAAFVNRYPWHLVIFTICLRILSIFLSTLLPNLPSVEPSGLDSSEFESQEINETAATSSVDQQLMDDEDPPKKRSTTTAGLDLQFIFRDVRLPMLLAVFLILMPQYILLQGIFLQYVSNLPWGSLQTASVLASIQAGTDFVLSGMVLPWISSQLIHSWGYAVEAKDLLIIRGSLGFMIAGALLLGTLSSLPQVVVGVIISTCGTGASSAVRSLATSLVPENHVAMLNTVVAIIQTVGMGVSAPVLAKLMSVGSRLGDKGLSGLPYLVCSGLFLMTAIGLIFLRTDDEQPTSTDQHDETDQ